MYGAVGVRVCDECAGPATAYVNPLIVCQRCAGSLCRRCFSRRCAVEVPSLPPPLPARLVLSLPLALSLPWCSPRVCAPCLPAAIKEEVFCSKMLPAMRAGDVFSKQPEKNSLLSALAMRSSSGGSGGGLDSGEAVMVTLTTAPSPAVSWQTLALERNAPKGRGSIPLAAVSQAVVQQPGEVGGSSGGGGSSSGGGDVENSGALRLLDAAGSPLLVLVSRDSRLLRRWAAGVNEALAVARLPYCSAFTAAGDAHAPASKSGVNSTSGVSASISRADNIAHARAAEVAAREARLDARQREREAFRASLGNVGMANTAAAMVRMADERTANAAGAGSGGSAGAVTAATAQPAAQPQPLAAAGAGGAASAAALAALSSMADRLRAFASTSLIAPGTGLNSASSTPGLGSGGPAVPPATAGSRAATRNAAGEGGGAVMRRTGAGSPHPGGLRGGPPPLPPAAANAAPAESLASSSSVFATRLGDLLQAQRLGAAEAAGTSAAAPTGSGAIASARGALASVGRSLRGSFATLTRDVLG